ncbi:MAG: Transposase [Polaromonas sp.]|jgi:hypothetical protein|nr:Transposase [Polaromonas sp.]
MEELQSSYMNSTLQISLNTDPGQLANLAALQLAFSEVCNALAPIIQSSRCWNRVALHHLAYKQLRERFPAMGSQMVCNAIYSASRTSRLVYQHPQSPFNLTRLGNKPLPLLRFSSTCPVYFDRHTLSVKDGLLSMYTLEGRIRFHLALRAVDEAQFHEKKLREIVLSRASASRFVLAFTFSADDDSVESAPEKNDGEIPEYVMVEETT